MELFQLLLLATLLATSSGHPITADSSPIQTPVPVTAPATSGTPEPAITTSSSPPFAGPGRSESQIMACTSTLGITYSRLPTPPYYPWCLSDGTETLYASTKTLERQVDCAGCLEVEVKTFPDGVACPSRTASLTTAVTTISLDATTTVYETVCSPTPTFADMLELRVVEARQEAGDGGVVETMLLKGAAAGLAPLACPTTLVVPQDGMGGTSTRFEKVVTVTSYINCGGCKLVISTRVGGLGPIMRPGITASQPTGTATSYICTA